MSYIKTNPLKNSTIMFLYSESEEIRLDPPYQRMGGVWTKEKKQLLIDSILNDYDIPKIYFHLYDVKVDHDNGYNYAVIDGRQRLETIWEFIEGKFCLSSDFTYQKNSEINLSGLSYDDISQQYPKIKIQLDSFTLPVILVETDDEDLIEDMFSRLNEAVPLNAPEKRNSIGGDLVRAIREVASHQFFEKEVSFNNNRYQHLEIAARFLLIEDSLACEGRLVDTKKVYLDSLAKRYIRDNIETVNRLKSSVLEILEEMVEVFTERDELLKSQGSMAIYYLLFKKAMASDELGKITRRRLLDFNQNIKDNRALAAENYEDSSFALLEYDRLTQQGTNDASNIKERVSVLSEYMDLG